MLTLDSKCHSCFTSLPPLLSLCPHHPWLKTVLGEARCLNVPTLSRKCRDCHVAEGLHVLSQPLARSPLVLCEQRHH